MNKKYFTISCYFVLSIVICTLFIAVLFNFSYIWQKIQEFINILMPFIYGFVLAYILNPAMRCIEQKIFPKIFKRKPKKKYTRTLALIGTYLFAFILLGLFAWVIIPQTANSVIGLVSKIPNYILQIDSWLNGLIASLVELGVTTQMVKNLGNYIESMLQNFYQWMTSMLPQIVSMTSKLTTGVMNFALGVIISIYMLASKEKFFAQCKKLLYAIFPKSPVDKVVEVTRYSHKIFSGFIFGKLLDSLIIGILCFIGLTILRMPDAMLVSVIVGITNIIPYFGPFIGAIPSFLIILMSSPVKSLWFLLFIFLLQQFDGNILGPKILGDSTGLASFWVIFAIIVFGGFFGPVGMFIGIPLFAVITSLVSEMVNKRLAKKELPTALDNYASDRHPLE